MSDLFNAPDTRPLAESMRPQALADVVGQTHLVGPNGLLRLAVEAQNLHSMILWGPPGVGKTTLAGIVARSFDAEFLPLSAVFSGIKDIREAVETAKRSLHQYQRRTILFVDEVHRFNKSQQDAFLPYVENGLLTFIGATTENPSFEVNPALLSRAQVYVLKSLTQDDLIELIHRVAKMRPDSPNFTDDAKVALAGMADGDARRLLNLLEQVLGLAKHAALDGVNLEFVQRVLSETVRRFDKNGDAFYDQISALHKSVRGSNPDAALYWLCRMLDGGADPKYLSRRIVRIAWEDIGLADPRAMQIANDAATTYERLGSPEGELALAQAVIYLATAAKSNAGYKAYNEVRAFVKSDVSRPVPFHLRNAPTGLMKKMGMGQAYRYAHDEPHAYAAGETYLPDEISQQAWYHPVPRGLEIKIAEKLAFLRELDALEHTKK